MKKQYKIKVDKKLIKKLKPYWEKYHNIHDEFLGQLHDLEKEMSREVGIKDLEFFMCDGYYCGIGTFNREMRLIHDSELE